MSSWISRVEALELGIDPNDLTKYSRLDKIKTDRTHKRRYLYCRDDVVAMAAKIHSARPRKNKPVDPDPLEKAFNHYVRSRRAA